MIAFEDASLPLREIPDTDWRSASPDYFRAMGIPLLRGRFFTEADAAGAPNAGIIDQRIANRVWPGQDPIGKRFKLGKLEWDVPWTTIVGVVGHIRNDSLDTDPRAQVYWSYLQRPQARTALVVRTRGEPMQLASAVRGQVRAVDPGQPVYDVRSMDDVMSHSVAQRRLTTLLLGIFAGLALMLAAIGIYGVISYSVSRRTREVGIRMALGARQGDVLGMVAKQGLLLALAGVGVGVGASLALTRVLAGMLFGITATDPLTFAAVSVFLVLVALAAAWLPARRAARTDPLVALRYE
jgi:putative ABC transport system permease protein